METEKIGLLNITLQFLAELWSRFFAPVAIDRDIETNGRVVQIIVRYKKKGKQDTKPISVEDLYPDVSVHS